MQYAEHCNYTVKIFSNTDKFSRYNVKVSMGAYTYNFNTWEVEMARSRVQGQCRYVQSLRAVWAARYPVSRK